MKKKSLIGLCLLPLFFAMMALSPACKKNDQGAPSISDVRQYVASPSDTVLSTGNPNTSPSLYGNGGYYVVIQGINLQNAIEIDFDGVPATVNPAFITSKNAVVQIPTINYTTVDTAKLYSITYKTKAGSTTFWFKLGPQKPTITAISNVFAAVGDSCYLYGSNLVLVKKFTYGGFTVSKWNSSSDGTSLGFIMPGLAANKSKVLLTTVSDTASYLINGTPTITGINNEDAAEGDSVYITGTYFKNLQSLMFGGTTITSFKTSGDLKTIAFVMPALTGPQSGGYVSVTTQFGTATTVFKVEDFVDMFQNWDNVNGYPWGLSGTSNSDYPGNTGWYGELNNATIGGNDYAWYNGGRGVNMGGAQWVPASDISNSPANYAVKFELYVPKSSPWLYGSLFVAENYTWNYIGRYRPWINKAGTITPYYTHGWQTVTLPLSTFANNNGQGPITLPSISALVGSSGNTGMNIWFINDTSATVKNLALAIDNIRVVKIK